ncbi:MAG: gliding motility protein GldN [Bacteroidaceae bacterium]|nr:gliding motility protein GldN [Bacteroidaceae bacterium]MBR6714032.1 gliding motility protein GldN [Bacteroidaceae bacterium]
MKRTLILLSIMLVAIATVAQPPARIRQQAKNGDAAERTAPAVPVVKTTASAAAKKNAASSATTASSRAALEFPTQGAMPEDVAWRRDVYKVLDLSSDRNAVLYFPEEPTGDKMNLFTYLFKLVMRKQVKAYEYTIDGNENLTAKNVMQPKEMLTRFEINYETNDEGKLRVDNSDIPSAQVKSYYIKESTYYDQNTAQFHTQVTALCPVRRGIDEFGEEEAPTPLFWLDYSEISPYLAKIVLMNSNYNNAAQISADDYFTTNQYEGKIYKTVNLQGRVLQNYCETDSALKAEQTRIEKEIITLQDHVWGKDSSKMKKDTLQAETANEEKTVTKKSSKKGKEEKVSESNSSRAQVKRERSAGSGRSSSQPKFSARRQRH